MLVVAVRSTVWVGASRLVEEWKATPVLRVRAVGAGANCRPGEGVLWIEVQPVAVLCRSAGRIVNLVLKNGRGG